MNESKNPNFTITQWKEILKSKKIDIILTVDQLKIIIERVGNKIDENGYVIDSKTKEKVTSNDSAEIAIKEVGAILPGSKVFIRNNIASFSQYLSRSLGLAHLFSCLFRSKKETPDCPE